MRRLVPAGLLCALGLVGCQTMAAGKAVPASVDLSDPQTVSRLKSALAPVIGRAHIEFGPSAASQPTMLSVLPPPLGPLETHSTALPAIFDVVIKDGKCLAVRHDTGAETELKDVTCRPVQH
ncbi:hypothetical protein [Asticcacaulis excentricus]|uniref:Putative lipoprotein n=1 Tax=Asticcacaulis excentricus (strain ATCC 15261 / DSM 4724 / KCTC 12464 / NCIMB 9791 / VKM B-1370 / CB 48) TaxID=573065 RepID=E8RS74_ASTEC|nr:hypothetical protein [Asticcacaulis excentricus]ADU14345.1 putative lipoprotein [Asticcacaulis excentricus CB 48]